MANLLVVDDDIDIVVTRALTERRGPVPKNTHDVTDHGGAHDA